MASPVTAKILRTESILHRGAHHRAARTNPVRPRSSLVPPGIRIGALRLEARQCRLDQ
jgi:hypothetical protein